MVWSRWQLEKLSMAVTGRMRLFRLEARTITEQHPTTTRCKFRRSAANRGLMLRSWINLVTMIVYSINSSNCAELECVFEIWHTRTDKQLGQEIKRKHKMLNTGGKTTP